MASGTVEELTSSGPEVLRFGAPAGLPLDALRAALPTSVATDEAEPGRYEVDGAAAGRRRPAGRGDRCVLVRRAGVLPQGLAVGRRSLEDVVLELTGGPSRWAA
ncbi:MAG: hypothetical protein PGN11_11545 [Quadrisphaera sp.]